tara:strand:+ start:56 stop:451 length:396 start_codon:yes stop_codon:yes gene_type:complete
MSAEKNIIEVEPNSNIAKILQGKTRGYYDWYVRDILKNSHLYKIIDMVTQKDQVRNQGLLDNDLEKNLNRLKDEIENIREYTKNCNELRGHVKRKYAHLTRYCYDRIEAIEFQVSKIQEENKDQHKLLKRL